MKKVGIGHSKFYKHKSKFQNPIHQNYKHVKAIQNLLEINDDIIHNVVVFVGSATFKTDKPKGVYNIRGLKRLLKSSGDNIFSAEDISKLESVLINGKENNSFKNKRKHVKDLRQRYLSEDICPKCGDKLVQRTIKKGKRQREIFLGCNSFPKC